jgi:hypothetical protein
VGAYRGKVRRDGRSGVDWELPVGEIPLMWLMGNFPFAGFIEGDEKEEAREGQELDQENL